MPIVTKQSTGERLTDIAAIASALATHGVVYERWDIGKYDPAARPEGTTEQEYVLASFAKEVATISQARGYKAADVIALHPETPNLDVLLAKFDKEHTHSEDEVRFVVSGRGVFAVRGVDGEMYDVEVHPGDLLAVPEGTQHWFTLCDDRHIQCIRLFTDPGGWVASYVNPDGSPVAAN
ncbi:MAG: cupin domain-containing protein [Myxococcales bacterium]|nr:cupin domain-containing protein [Myxococcales bacterium]MCB9520947.1 cupin domain-containing protein [Myxococcales bacterium]MCB9531689.1 cupin domain-containing protein [Myxococcales bacterium]MCB9534424.1 cupin domain-containing protein [Myxococcales bacterium]